MKKLFLFLALLVIGISTMAQYGVSFTFATPATKVPFFIGKDNTIKVKSTHIDYSVLKDIPAGTLISTAIADPTILYPVGSTAASTSTITTLTATTATITTGTLTTAVLGGKALTTKDANGGTYAGSLTVATGDTLFSPVIDGTTKIISPLMVGTAITASTTLTLPGTTTITKTTGNANSATFSHSARATDSLAAPVINASTKVYSPIVAATTTLTLPNTKTLTKTTGNGNSSTITGSVVAGDSISGTTLIASGYVAGGNITITNTDTITAAPVGTICFKISDSTAYMKIRMTGTTHARWKKLW